MCNHYRLIVDVASIVECFADLKINIRFTEGLPNVQPHEDIKITAVAPIIRTVDGLRGEGDLVKRRWSWPGHNKRPVYNFRSEGREFRSNRCLIVADGFYEFTDPVEKRKKRKTSGFSPSVRTRSFALPESGARPRRSARPSRC
jgi:putative SOS response-associated peptidase YedK